LNYYGAKELAASLRTVRKNTVTIASDIPEDKYGFRSAPETRTVAELLSHIAASHNFQFMIHAEERRTTLDGINFPALMQKFVAEEKVARTKDQIIELLRTSGERFAGWLEGVSDDFLGEPVAMSMNSNMPPKSRFEMILGVKEHEMHHRGQLMLIERQLGIVPHLTREMQARFAAGTAAAAANTKP
jgi:uncharacterized damage-inducible protein DinB